MSKALIAVGYWITSLNDDSLFPPQEFVSTGLSAGVASYLRSGETYEQYRGFSWCRFQCGTPSSEMGSRDLTDGTWVWPEGLAHYVESHNVNLPPGFVNLIASSVRTAPAFWSQHDPVEFYVWEAWCRDSLSADYVNRLEVARDETGRLAEQMLRGHVRDVEQRIGFSSNPCAWAECSNRALLGVAYCAKCATKLQPGYAEAAANAAGLGRFLSSYAQH